MQHRFITCIRLELTFATYIKGFVNNNFVDDCNRVVFKMNLMLEMGGRKIVAVEFCPNISFFVQDIC